MAGSDKPISSKEMIRAARDQLDVGEASAQMVDAARKDVEERNRADAEDLPQLPDVEQPATADSSPDNLVATVRDQARRSQEDLRDEQTESRPLPPVSSVPGPVATTSSSRRRVIPVIVGVLILLSLVSRIFDDGSSDSNPVPPPTVSVTAVTQPPPTTPTAPGARTSGTMRIDANMTLTGHHQGSIVIVEDGIALDCAGRAVIGSAGRGVGISVQALTEVTIRNCEVRGFDTGIELSNASDVELESNTATGNKVGFMMVNSNGSRLIDNSAIENTANGILLVRSERNSLVNNTVEGGHQGILLNSADNNILQGNQVTGATDWFGFGFINGAQGNRMISNRAEDSGSGFAISGAYRNTFSGNVAVDNAVGFNVLDEFGTELNNFAGNVAQGNTEDGFRDMTRGQQGDRATENFYSDNSCEDNGVASSPPFLCE